MIARRHENRLKGSGPTCDLRRPSIDLGMPAGKELLDQREAASGARAHQELAAAGEERKRLHCLSGLVALPMKRWRGVRKLEHLEVTIGGLQNVELGIGGELGIMWLAFASEEK